MGFFIEEARDHLSTIERGLLDLQGTLEDPEMLNEVFRAAHSVKGGAAMLGLSAIQTISHRLEDSFKDLKELPAAVIRASVAERTRTLESLFLRIFDSLQELLDRLQSPTGLPDSDAQRIVEEIEPVCRELSSHIDRLARGETLPQRESVPHPNLPVTSPLPSQSEEESVLQLIFQSDVLARLREMLQLFKQPDTPEVRQSLQQICRLLAQIGEQFDLDAWGELLKTARAAIARPENTFASLVSIVIKDIKQAQELVLTNRADEIAPSTRLCELVPQRTATRTPEAEAVVRNGNRPEEQSDFQPTKNPSRPPTSGTPRQPTPHPSNGPEVGMAELSSLADLFEGGNEDLEDWQEVEHLESLDLEIEGGGDFAGEDSDFSDLFLDDNIDNEAASASHQDVTHDNSHDRDTAASEETELTNLFGDNFFADRGDIQDADEDDTGLDDLLNTVEMGRVVDVKDSGEEIDLDADFQDLLDIGIENGDEIPADEPDEPIISEPLTNDLFEAEDMASEIEPENRSGESIDRFDLDELELEDEIDLPVEEALSLGEESAAELEALFGQTSRETSQNLDAVVTPSHDAPSLDENADFGDLFDESDGVVSEVEVTETEELDFGDFDLSEPSSETAAEVSEELDFGDFDLSEPPSETAAETAEELDFGDFDLSEPSSETAAETAEELDFGDFDLSEPPSETAAEASEELDRFASEPTDVEELSLDDLLGENLAVKEAQPETSEEAFDLDALLEDADATFESELEPPTSEFPELEILLNLEPQFLGKDVFDALEDYLDRTDISPVEVLPSEMFSPAPLDLQTEGAAEERDRGEFSDLEDLLKELEPSTPAPSTSKSTRSTTKRSRTAFEQTMRVPIKQLDNLSNLVGELVVNRNSLEQDQERLRQFLDNLLHQVSQLTEVGQQMQDLYERTLLEMALLASRQNRKLMERRGHQDSERDDGEYDALEMDRFTAFHTHAQDIIELVVRVRESASDIEFLVDENEQITRQLRQITNQLREDLTRSRMVPFANAADRLPRGVRDNAIKFGKQVDLQIEGRDTLIDRMILEHLYDPLTHLVNNAIAHGIEPSEDRTVKGKSPTGKITVSSFHQGNQTIISIADDGAGIDVDKVKSKALQKGLIKPEQARSMSDLEVYDLLFLPGLSTRDKADDLAGRGVGMDVVKTKLNEIRGVVNTDSTPNKGTTFTIRLPLTLSISKALCCISDHAPIAFPMDGVGEVLDNLPTNRIVKEPDGRSYVQWRDQQVPYQPLRDLFTYNRISRRSKMYGSNAEEDTISVVVLRSGGSYLAISVDRIVGEQEIVIKQLEGPAPKPMGITGATVMGDGRIVPIADVLELIDLSMGRVRHDPGSTLWDDTATAVEETAAVTEKSEPMVLIVDDSITVRELLSMTFKKSGYRVEQARDGQEAWEKLRSGLPCELVFCDMEMPRMNGMELLEKMHNDSQLHDLPIAMLTSRTAEKMKRKAAELGARGYFTKPYLEEVLLDAAQRMLSGEVLMAAPAAETSQDA